MNKQQLKFLFFFPSRSFSSSPFLVPSLFKRIRPFLGGAEVT